MPVNDANDSKHYAGCDLKEDVELERSTQGPQDGAGNHQTWLNARTDPFILKFPPEISSHIFSLSMGTSGDKLPTPFLLGSVCRGWRLLARSTPELWSIVSFRLGKPPRKPEGLSQLEAVSNWLQLSGDASLTLHVFKYWGSDSVEGCDPVIDILNQHSGRWEKLLLYIPASLFPRLCGTSPPSRLWDLHVIGIHDRVPAIFKMCSRPSPTHLTLSYLPLSTLDIKWDNVTFLKMTLTAAPFCECIEAIQQAPLLEMCSITLCSMNILPSIPKVTVRHMRLRTLKLVCFPVETLCGFLDVLELPSLQAYHHQTLDLELSVDSLISFLNRSGMDFKQLTLNVTSLRKEDLKKLFTAAPSLQNLQLDFWCTGHMFLVHGLFEDVSSSLPFLGDGPGFLPSLQSLTISARGAETLLFACIPPLLSTPHRKLLRLEVSKGGETEIDTLRKIKRLIRKGFDVRIIGAQGDVDYLQRFTKKLGEANELEFVDYALESESVTAAEDREEVSSAADEDKKGCLSSLSGFTSRLFCRR